MYVVTFYSYKGGVGRTLALVNVAMSLAQAGRRVLLVDFDLEAPGLDTFNLPKPRGRQKGLVEYVNEYLRSGQAPDISPYVYRSPESGAEGGRLWIMPAGDIDDGYGARFNSISWQELYERHDGYLFFENLKAEWKRHIAPDYVLVDSRTGHTDVGGICTRQLPDAVVLMFFPNEQNRRGISQVAQQIQAEGGLPRKKGIRIHFVMSNVPELDDEDEVLDGFVSRFREELLLEDKPLTIHHYPSLDLVKQGVFAITHPNSRLAKQYRRLADLLRSHNLEDPDGALAFVKQTLRQLMRNEHGVTASNLAPTLGEIRRLHDDNPNVLMAVGEAWQLIGQTDDASAAFDQASAAGAGSPRLWLGQCLCREELGDREGVCEAAERVLEYERSTDYHVSQAINVLARTDPRRLAKAPESPAVRNLKSEERFWVAKQLAESEAGLPAAYSILRCLDSDEQISDELRSNVRHEIVLACIARGAFEEAMAMIGDVRSQHGPVHIVDLFNSAMAEWGAKSSPPSDLFARVLATHEESATKRDSPNYFQCLAVCAWAIGDSDEANTWAERARQQMLSRLSPEFSCWRYMTVSLKSFLDDLDELVYLIGGGEVIPRFMRVRTATPESAEQKLESEKGVPDD